MDKKVLEYIKECIEFLVKYGEFDSAHHETVCNISTNSIDSIDNELFKIKNIIMAEPTKILERKNEALRQINEALENKCNALEDELKKAVTNNKFLRTERNYYKNECDSEKIPLFAPKPPVHRVIKNESFFSDSVWKYIFLGYLLSDILNNILKLIGVIN